MPPNWVKWDRLNTYINGVGLYGSLGTILGSKRDEIVKLRSRSRSGPKGPKTKDQRHGPGLTLKLVCHHHHPPPANFSSGGKESKPLLNDF